MAKSTISTGSQKSSSIVSVSDNSQNNMSGSQAGALTKSATNVSMKRHSKTQRNTQATTDKRKRVAANARERKRMHLLNSAYDKLRKRLADAENKSKYDVLVQAKEYIQALARICETHDKTQGPTTTTTITTTTTSGQGCQDLFGRASRISQASKGNQKPDSLETKAPHRSGIINDNRIKLESPRSIAESHCTEVDIDCCSPDSLSSPCLNLPELVRWPTASNIIFPYQTASNGHQQVTQNLSCSTILNSPPPATTHYHYSNTTMTALRPDYLPRICQVKHQQLSQLNLTNADIYHKYAQAFQYIQRAT